MEYSRTDFLTNLYIQIHGEEELKDRLSLKEPFLSFDAEDKEITDLMAEVQERLNPVLKNLGIDKELTPLNTIHLLEESFETSYSSILCNISFDKIYSVFLEDEIIKQKQEMVTFYRIEDAKGNGLYTHYSDIGDPLHKRFELSTNQTPSPMEDGIIKTIFGFGGNLEMRKEMSFGFKTKEQIHEWLNGCEPLGDYIIDNPNLYINEYTIEDKYVLASECQLIYKKDNAKLIAANPMTQFLKELNAIQHIRKLEEGFKKEDEDIINSFIKENNKSITDDIDEMPKKENKKTKIIYKKRKRNY